VSGVSRSQWRCRWSFPSLTTLPSGSVRVFGGVLAATVNLVTSAPSPHFVIYVFHNGGPPASVRLDAPDQDVDQGPSWPLGQLGGDQPKRTLYMEIKGLYKSRLHQITKFPCGERRSKILARLWFCNTLTVAESCLKTVQIANLCVLEKMQSVFFAIKVRL
jgi:hypothetical protein